MPIDPLKKIIERQVQWAKNKGINLIGSKGEKGERVYTEKLEQNLFKPLRKEIEQHFNKGKGGELIGYPCKMQALHSSSALAVNIFQYWMDEPYIIASVCSFCDKNQKVSEEIVFEKKCSIGLRGTPPHIDVVIYNHPSWEFKRFAIEIKFTEPYQFKRRNINSKPYFSKQYGINSNLKRDIWNEIPNLLALAKAINSNEKVFTYLDATQLIKHILGLKREWGKNGFKLLYLWYDLTDEQFKAVVTKHREEIEEFSSIAKADGIHFSSMTIQELITKLVETYKDEHQEYIKYLTERYL